MPSDLQDYESEVENISRDLVSELAPDELELFDDLAQEYRANPNPPDATHGTDSALGFGLDAGVVAMSPAVMAAVTGAFGFVVTIAADTLKEQSKTVIVAAVKKLFEAKKSEPAASEPAPIVLTPDQLREVQKIAAEQARRFGLKKDEAEKLADSLAGRLAMGG